MSDTVRTAEYELVRGDCLEVMRGMAANSVHCVVTDPPYGIEYTHGNQSKNGRSGLQVQWSAIDGDESVDGRWLREVARILKPSGAVYFLTRWDVEPKWRNEIIKSGLLLKQRLTWHKRVNGKGDLLGTYQPTCEDILFSTKGRHELNYRPSMLLDVGCVPTWEYRYHPYQKPVTLAEMLICASTQPSDVVLDPFMGSGFAGIAAMKTGRKFVGIEQDAHYHAIAARRIADAARQARGEFAHIAGDDDTSGLPLWDATS